MPTHDITAQLGPHSQGRRQFLRAALGTSTTLWGASLLEPIALGQIAGERPARDQVLEVLNPKGRVPVSWIIDDSTCLVNLNRFAIPQFAEAWNNGGGYDHDWRAMPSEIPDSFVRKFGSWCAEHGVRGKYSIVPYPACVGRLDRVVPGWTRREIDASLELVRSLMMPNWDIHPELVSHTWAIDTRTGHPYPDRNLKFMENWQWTDGKSVDELTDYLAYALKILRNVELPCEGITTPGGFGNRVLPELAQATFEACRDVFKAEIPHYFRHLYDEGDRSVAPRVEYAADLASDAPRCVVSIIGCTGDWTGGWDCRGPIEVDRFITPDLGRGRMVDVIERGEPAVMVCHWTGIYDNGQERGFAAIQEVVRRLHARYDHLIWMKNSELARYWAAKELTQIVAKPTGWEIRAPYDCPDFTLAVPVHSDAPPRIVHADETISLRAITQPSQLASGCCYRQDDRWQICWPLAKGESILEHPSR